MAQIVGVVLIKNEDLYIEWVLENIVGFCDHIIVLDNHSTDHTWEIIERLAGDTGRIDLRKWDFSKDSQNALSQLTSVPGRGREYRAGLLRQACELLSHFRQADQRLGVAARFASAPENEIVAAVLTRRSRRPSRRPRRSGRARGHGRRLRRVRVRRR